MATLIVLGLLSLPFLALTWWVERPIPTELTADRSRGTLPADWQP